MDLVWSRVNSAVVWLTQLCQTHCHRPKLEEEGGGGESSSSLWYELLECVIAPQSQVPIDNREAIKPFKDLVKLVVNSSMGYVNLRYDFLFSHNLLS